MSNLTHHAEQELTRLLPSAGDADDYEMQAEMNESILACVRAFSEFGHSGGSAPYAIAMLEKLLNFEPISPLTGEGSEWIQVSDGSGPIRSNATYQNKRCGRVFKENGIVYALDVYVFTDKGGIPYTTGMSRARVKLPGLPPEEPVYVKTWFGKQWCRFKYWRLNRAIKGNELKHARGYQL